MVDWRSIDEGGAFDWRSIEEEASAPAAPPPAVVPPRPVPDKDYVLRGTLAIEPRSYRLRTLFTIAGLAALLNHVISFSIAALAHLSVFIVVAGIVMFIREEADGDVALFAGLNRGGDLGTQDLGEKEKNNENTEQKEKLPEATKPVAPQPEVKTEPQPTPGPGPTTKTDAQPIASSKQLEGRGGNRKGELLKKYGGNDASEAAVELGLQWLADHQSEGGSWEAEEFIRRCPKSDCRDERAAGDPTYTPGLTGLATLAFLGAGYTHLDGAWKKQVSAALGWLQKLQRQDGGFSTYDAVNLYNHTICTWALAEAFAMTKDEALRKPAQLAMDHLVQAQYRGGGWDYLVSDDPDEERNDTSIGGWAVMAMKSGLMGGLNVPKVALDRVTRLVESRTDKKTGELVYAERKPGVGRRGDGLVAVGMLCRIYLNMTEAAPLKAGAGRLLRNLPDWKRMQDSEKAAAATGGFNPNCNMYYWYYGTLAMFQVGGEYWESWNGALRDLLVDHQVKTGHKRGSWDPEATYIGREGGRVFSTAINILNLEIYYRYLPLYAIDEGLAVKLKWNERSELFEKAKSSASNGERMQALTELAKRRGDAEVSALLAECLKDRDPVVRLHASKLLGERKDKAALKFLEEAIRREDSGIRGAMLEAVGHIGDKSSTPFLIGFLRDENERAAKGALQALKWITGQDFGLDADAWSGWWAASRK